VYKSKNEYLKTFKKYLKIVKKVWVLLRKKQKQQLLTEMNGFGEWPT